MLWKQRTCTLITKDKLILQEGYNVGKCEVIQFGKKKEKVNYYIERCYKKSLYKWILVS